MSGEPGTERSGLARGCRIPRFALAIDNARLYDEAQTALAVSDAALEMRDQVLSIASHELRTPLTAFKGQVQLVERGFTRGAVEKVPNLIRQANLHVDRLAGLIRDLFAVSRISAGGFATEPEPVALGAVIGGIVE